MYVKPKKEYYLYSNIPMFPLSTMGLTSVTTVRLYRKEQQSQTNKNSIFKEV
jgi:hypothetical protein